MKTRKGIPRATRENLLKEFSHKCSMCGASNPQIHHLDENPSNNSILNLLPLCPNCHLSDQHNPTTRRPYALLSLFRRHKSPVILSPQFQVVFERMNFLYEDLSMSDRSSI